ncbi:MAG: ATP-binding protein [Anaerolineae bacterium]|nr:ATP-binding protein [Anaerolineae bacterium]
MRDVPVGHPDFGRAVPCRCKEEEIRRRRLARLRTASNLDALQHMTFETFRPEGIGLSEERRRNLCSAYEAARRFAEQPEGWLLLMGGYGCGKTHLAAAIANERLARGDTVLFIAVPDLLDYLRATFSPTSDVGYDEQFEAIRQAPLLILDDLGAQASTPWAQEKLFQLFNYRYNARLPTVITTNQRLDEIEIRVRSRLSDPTLVQIVPILAPDFRRSGVDQFQSELSSLNLHSHQTFETFDLRAQELTAAEYDNLQRAVALAEAYAESPKGWLVLLGTFGCGKTHLAAAIANRQVALGRDTPMFVVVPDLLDHLRAAFSPASLVSYDKRFDEVRTTPLLILDDLGTESATPWAREKLFQLLNYRYVAQLPTVITSSDPIDKIEPRLRTRMLDPTRCKVFVIEAPAYRGPSTYPTSGKKRRASREP